MPRSSLIVAYDQNKLIGKNGNLPWHLADDLKNFKQITLGKTLLMGRKTYESIGAKPLAKRENWVLSTSLHDSKVKCFNNWEDMLQAANNLENDWCVIGGASLYAKAISIVDDLYITEVNATLAGDVYFPDINLSNWQCKEKVYFSKNANNDYDFCCYLYSRVNHAK